MRKHKKDIDTSNLKKDARGRNDWNGSIGANIPFNYFGKEGFLNLVKCDGRIAHVEYDGQIKEIDKSKLLNGQIGTIIGEYSYDYRFKIGEIFNGMTICEFTRLESESKERKGDRAYICKCLKCGHYNEISEYNIKTQSCSACSGHTIIPGNNDLTTTHPHLVSYFPGGKDEAQQYSKGSGAKVHLVCPICKRRSTRKVTVSNLVKHCSVPCLCKDGISYPEKFVYNMLIQLGIYFQYHYSAEWTNGKIYDFFIPSLNLIIETHGAQHYFDTTGSWNVSLAKQQKIDAEKREQALKIVDVHKPNIENYVELDCRYSEMEYVSDSIKKDLAYILNLKGVDFKMCDLNARKSILVEVCKLKSDEPSLYTSDLADIFNLSKTTIKHYLTIGSSLGLVDYDPIFEEARNRVRLKALLPGSKRVIVEKEGQIIGVFQSQNEVSRLSEQIFGRKYSPSLIGMILNGKVRQIPGYILRREPVKDSDSKHLN